MSDEVIIPTPKLLSDYAGVHETSFSGALLAKQPAIALGISLTIAHMAAVDAVYDQIVVQLLGAEGYSVSAMLRSIKSHHERHKLTIRLIEEKLEKDHRELFILVKNKIQPIRDIRNKFSHGLWGESPTIPNSLLLGESKPFGDALGASLQLMQAAAPLERAKSFILNMIDAKHGLGETEKQEALAIVLEMDEDVRQQKAWSLFFPKEGEPLHNNPEVWTNDDALLAAKAAEAAYVTVAACSSCIGPMAQEVAPILARVRSEGLLRQVPRRHHSHSAT
ncbi:hypothetical protein LQT97_00480 [Brucella pseudogrignonensis]|uniref:hypothetical protein n=1 Tax=Brucella pseudogrignonensis TaxID=419475 RepID=UPI001E33508A|nr:hypothetical protein [Brucella pseudogrignonensis]MCD4509699.1 hypothetical protein [Brucella pseudogrignonensis]